MAIANLLNVNFLVPWVAHNISNVRAIRGLRGMPRSVLLVGFKDAAGGLPLDTIKQVSTEADANALAGQSMLLDMWLAASRAAGFGLPISMIALDATGLNQAAGSLVVSAASNKAGVIYLWLGGVPINVVTTEGESANGIATKLRTAINANPQSRVTAAGTGATVDLTANVPGELGNLIDVRVNYYDDQALPEGVDVAVTTLSGGAGNPDISPVITAMQGQRFTEIVLPFTDSTNMARIELELDTRWAADNAQDCQVMTVRRGTEGENASWLAARNNHNVHTIAVTKDLTNPWELAALAGAAIERQSAIDPAVPFTSIRLPGYLPAKAGEQFTPAQQNVMLLAGGSTLLGTEISRMVTNYTANGLGALDKSYRNLNWVKTLSYWRWFCISEWQLKYRQYKLVESLPEPIPGQKIMSKELAEEIALGLYDNFVDVALMQNAAHYKETLLVEIDATNGKVKIIEQPVLVTQHYQTETTSEFIAGTV